jgi:hypothetical protein
VTLPDAHGRFISLMPVDEDHYTAYCLYAPGTFRFTRNAFDTRYVALLVRTFTDPNEVVPAFGEVEVAVPLTPALR